MLKGRLDEWGSGCDGGVLRKACKRPNRGRKPEGIFNAVWCSSKDRSKQYRTRFLRKAHISVFGEFFKVHGCLFAKYLPSIQAL